MTEQWLTYANKLVGSGDSHSRQVTVTLLIQLSVVLSAVLAFFFLGEIPFSLQVIGSVVAIGGVTLVVWRKV